MKVSSDGHAVSELEHQWERRFRSNTKPGPSAVLFIGDRRKERRFGSGTKIGPSAILFEGDNREEHNPESGVKRRLNLPENDRWLLAGQIVLIAAVIFGWRIVTEGGPDIAPLQTPGTAETTQSAAAVHPVTEAHEEQVAGMNERVAKPTDAINHRLSISAGTAEQELTASVARTQAARPEPGQTIETLPPAADELQSGQINRSQPSTPPTSSMAAAQSAAGNVVPTADGTAVPDADHALPVAKTLPAGRVGTDGPWEINLVSSSRKADADRFEKKARSFGIKTEQQPVTINGRQYWRVRITGFATASEARSYAGTARDKLGLTDVWITRR